MHETRTAVPRDRAAWRLPVPAPATPRTNLKTQPDAVFQLGTRAMRLAQEYRAVQASILRLCDELPAEVAFRRDVAPVLRLIKQASRHAHGLAETFLEGRPAPGGAVESLDAAGVVKTAQDGARSAMAENVHVHLQLGHGQLPLRGIRQDLELIFGSLLLLSGDAMPTGGRIHLFVGVDAWAHTRPVEVGDGPYVRVRLVDNGGAWATSLLDTAEGDACCNALTLAALRAAVERNGGHITCAKARVSGNTIEVLLPAATVQLGRTAS